MEKARVVLIGTGAIGRVHAAAAHGSPLLDLVAVVNRSERGIKECCQGHQTRAYRTVADMLRLERPDFAIIATPHPSHAPLATKCLQSGVPVLIEKPFTVSSTEAKKVLAVAKAKGLPVGVNFQMRLRPAHVHFRRLAQEGRLGNMIRATLVSTQWFRSEAYYRSQSWRGDWKGEGGGLLVNQAPHDLDLLLSVAGLPSRVFASFGTEGHDIPVEDDFAATLEWENGARGTIHFTTRESPGEHCMTLTGTKGTLRLENGRVTLIELETDSEKYSMETGDLMTGPPIAREESWLLPDTVNRYALMQENFLQAIRGESPLVCSGAEGHDEALLAEALFVSACLRRSVDLNEGRYLAQALRQEMEDAGSLRAYFAKHASSQRDHL